MSMTMKDQNCVGTSKAGLSSSELTGQRTSEKSGLQMDEFPLLWDPAIYQRALIAAHGSITKAARKFGLGRSTLYRALQGTAKPSQIVRAAIAEWRGVDEAQIWPEEPQVNRVDLEEPVQSVVDSSVRKAIRNLLTSAKKEVQAEVIANKGQEPLIQDILNEFKTLLGRGADCSIVLGFESDRAATKRMEVFRNDCSKLGAQSRSSTGSDKGVFRFIEVDSNFLPCPLHLAIDRVVYYQVVPGLIGVAFRTVRPRSRRRP